MSLAEIRDQIDAVDDALVELLARREALVRSAAAVKNDEAAVRAPDRVAQVVSRARAKAAMAGLSPDVAEAVWRAMIAAFIGLEMAERFG